MSEQTAQHNLGPTEAGTEIIRLNKIIKTLIEGSEHSANAQVSDFSLLQTNLMLEEQVRQLNTEIERRNKDHFAELDAFSYSISHDLRAPLRAIDGFSKMLQDGFTDKLGEEGQRLLTVVRNNTMRMAKLIDDILAFSRVSHTDLARHAVNMEELADSVIADLTPSFENRDVKIGRGNLPPTHGDVSMLRQVFVNLLGNSIKFTLPKTQAKITLGSYDENNETVYFVQDNGVGFDMQYVNKLFGVFQRLHSNDKFEGTGIGLAIVKRIITRHGGRVWATGKENEGATIYFTIPVDGEIRE